MLLQMAGHPSSTWPNDIALYMFLCVCAQSLRCVGLFAIPWIVSGQGPLYMGFPRQEY